MVAGGIFKAAVMSSMWSPVMLFLEKKRFVISISCILLWEEKKLMLRYTGNGA